MEQLIVPYGHQTILTWERCSNGCLSKVGGNKASAYTFNDRARAWKMFYPGKQSWEQGLTRSSILRQVIRHTCIESEWCFFCQTGAHNIYTQSINAVVGGSRCLPASTTYFTSFVEPLQCSKYILFMHQVGWGKRVCGEEMDKVSHLTALHSEAMLCHDYNGRSPFVLRWIRCERPCHFNWWILIDSSMLALWHLKFILRTGGNQKHKKRERK